ncbi:putative wall-associated receptor kinase, galacturonan-binding domain-containing protein [Helianthus debilis subsp. tardiflorus]
MSLFLAHLHLFIFLSLIATSNAIAKYAKPGCSDTCGNVTIPYPFGIGADCSVNEWYIVDCNYSTPYLSALKQLEVLGVNLEDQTIIVNTPTISYCHNLSWFATKTMSIDLVMSPFLFSKSHNMFVSEGCGNAVMMDNERVVTGCSAYCQDDIVSERNNCYGINCCQATIPHYLKSYNMNLTSVDGDGGCKYAFLVDEDSYIK